MFALAFGVALAGSLAYGHGPQIQITIDPEVAKIVTREIVPDEDYFNALTIPKQVYVMPLLDYSGVWYSRPNDAPHPILPNQPQYFSGPGFTYGFDRADGGTQEFAQNSVLTLNFTEGLKLWDGAAFNDPGLTQFKAFSGSNIDTASNFTVTTDGGPSGPVTVGTVGLNYSPNVHVTIRYGLLGNGTTSLSDSPNGVYLASLQLSSTQDGLAPSDEFLFVLPKNVPYATVVAAVDSLGYAPSAVQWLIPEPGSLALASLGAIGLAVLRRRQNQKRKCG
jgi:hypothetical protein